MVRIYYAFFSQGLAIMENLLPTVDEWQAEVNEVDLSHQTLLAHAGT